VLVEGAARGALTLARATGGDEFGPDDEAVATLLATQASLALVLGKAREAHEQSLLVGERDRIARDLHDQVIQRLFSFGLTLQGGLARVDDERARSTVWRVIDGLDDTIRAIRSTIFELHPTATAVTGLRSQLLDVVREAAAALGFEPGVQFTGPVDASVPAEAVDDVVAVLREALSNAARHGQPTGLTVEVSAGDDFVLVVTDNGSGFAPGGRQSGLANMRARAERRGGRFEVDSAVGRGSRLEWRVPV